jgi:NADH-quinone oxidoreductase subunit N
VTLDTVLLLYPEIVVLLVATWTYVGGAFTRQDSARWNWFALGGLAVAGLQLARQAESALVTDHVSIYGPVTEDALMYFARWVALGMGVVFVLATMRPHSRGQSSEIVGSILMVVAGLMLVSGATELVTLFLALELISIPTYVLLYLGRRGAGGDEAVTKYFFLSILSSAVMLYGFSFLYGLSGAGDLNASTSLADIRASLSAAEAAGALSPLANVALVLVMGGLAFKLAAVPFHFYAPDVYQGTSSVNAGLLAVAAKIAGLIALVRVLFAMPGMESLALAVISAVALLTMTLGNVMALWQTNVRRMLAYSSVAHSGYLLIGLVVALHRSGDATTSAAGLAATLFYTVVYALASGGAFAALAYFARGSREVETLDDLAGIGRTRPGVAALLAVFMFSLAGIPPLAGFWGKLALFTGPLDIYLASLGTDGVTVSESGQSLGNWYLAIAVIGVLNAAVAAAYYLRIIAAMYFRPSIDDAEPQGGFGALVAATLCGVAVIAGGIFPGTGLKYAQSASRTTLLQAYNSAPAIQPAAEQTAQR